MKPVLLLFIALFSFSVSAFAILTPQVDSIPMHDGKKLLADVYIPKGMTSGPVILIQTPYNRLLYRINLPLGVKQNIDSSQYIFVIVDWRGFYGSKAAKYSGSPDGGSDGYDVVEWIATQSWSNGKVGTWGPSALGRVQFTTAKKNPPHLTCICPLVAGPQYNYNEYFPGGCLRTEYVDQLDGLGFGLSPLLMANTVHNGVWTITENANFYPDSILVPCLMIGGWYDHNIEVMLPFYAALQTASPVSARDKHRLLMGPWVHGGHGAANPGSATQGQLSYPGAVGWGDSLAMLFFDFYLQGFPNGWEQTPKVQYFQMGDDIWQSSSAFPPPGLVNHNFYFHQSGLLDNATPTSSTDKRSFNYDPTNPSPTIGGTTLRADLDQGPYDQRDSVESRNDILIFTTDALTQNVVMKGNAVVHLKVSSDKTDTDFDVRLTDVYPDGRSMLLNDGVLRMRFRDGFDAVDTSLMVPGQVYDATITLPATCITFLAGHKIRVDVSSSNYPKYNRNMNTGGNMYPNKSMDTLVNPVTANNTVYTNATSTSYITLPLEGYSAIAEAQPAEGDILLFPNPATGQLTVSSERLTVSSIMLTDLLGRNLLTTQPTGNLTTLNISGLSRGIYLVTITTGSGVVVKKVTIH